MKIEQIKNVKNNARRIYQVSERGVFSLNICWVEVIEELCDELIELKEKLNEQ